MLDLKPLADALAEAWAAGAASPEELGRLRWELEEVRVATYAQELSLRGAPTAKKLAARIAALSGAGDR